MFEPVMVIGAPPIVAVWPLNTTVEAPGVADITSPPIVAIAAATPTGAATEVVFVPADGRAYVDAAPPGY
jgi:hypothetical protein